MCKNVQKCTDGKLRKAATMFYYFVSLPDVPDHGTLLTTGRAQDHLRLDDDPGGVDVDGEVLLALRAEVSEEPGARRLHLVKSPHLQLRHLQLHLELNIVQSRRPQDLQVLHDQLGEAVETDVPHGHLHVVAQY